MLASNGLDLPVLNVFRMFAKMSGQRVAVESTGGVSLDTILKNGVRENSDVSALASVDGNRLFVMVWNYHDDDVPGPDADVGLNLTGWPAGKIEQYRIDAEHSNAYEVWKQMGSPQQPTSEQYANLKAAGQLAQIDGSLRFKLPRQAVSLLVIESGNQTGCRAPPSGL